MMHAYSFSKEFREFPLYDRNVLFLFSFFQCRNIHAKAWRARDIGNPLAQNVPLNSCPGLYENIKFLENVLKLCPLITLLSYVHFLQNVRFYRKWIYIHGLFAHFNFGILGKQLFRVISAQNSCCMFTQHFKCSKFVTRFTPSNTRYR